MNHQKMQNRPPLLRILLLAIVLSAIGFIGNLARPDSLLGGYWLLVLPAAGLLLLAWGVWRRQPETILPGSLLGAIGVMAALVRGPFAAVDGASQLAVLMLALASGFLLATALTVALVRKMTWLPFLAGILTGGLGLAELFFGFF